MAKASYKIPDSLDKSWLDIEIAFQSDSGVGTRPLPMKFLLAVAASLVGCLAIVLNTPIKDGGIPFIVLFILLWAATSVFLLKLDKTGNMAFTRIPTVFSYMPKSARHVTCRMSNEAGPFCSATNMDGCDEERGIIKFLDGDVGYAYRVVGSGSVLLFEDDKDAILDRVDSFFRKMKCDYEMIFITAREPQNVRRQLHRMDERIAKLKRGDEELYALAMMERNYLSEYVGGSFRSIHQYLIIKAGNPEALELGRNMLQSEVEGSLLMFKRCSALFDEELRALFQSTFGALAKAEG